MVKWMEFIRVQIAQGEEQASALRLISFAQDLSKSPGLSAEVYVQSSENGDLAISLLWNTKQVRFMGSSVGLNIKEALKRYGLVDHSVWVKK